MSNPEIIVETTEDGLAEQSPAGVEIEVPRGDSPDTPTTVAESGITAQNSATVGTTSSGSSPGRKIDRYVVYVVTQCYYLTRLCTRSLTYSTVLLRPVTI